MRLELNIRTNQTLNSHINTENNRLKPPTRVLFTRLSTSKPIHHKGTLLQFQGKCVEMFLGKVTAPHITHSIIPSVCDCREKGSVLNIEVMFYKKHVKEALQDPENVDHSL